MRARGTIVRALATVFMTTVMTVAALALSPHRAPAQTCAAGTLNSCLTVSYTPVRPTPNPADFGAGFGVPGSVTVTVIKCGRPPCEVTAGAVNQPPSGLRLKIGGAAPSSLAECSTDITGVNSSSAAPAPTIALVNGPTTMVVWICQPLSWDPLVTPAGTWTPEFRFRLRHG